jgi:hypothetical protein
LDHDGHADFIVGAPGTNDSAGAAYVFSGVTGTLIYQVNGASEGDRLGGSVGIIDNQTGDSGSERAGTGQPADFIIGAPGVNNEAGAAYIYSGDDGQLIYQVNGASEGDRLGGSVGIIDAGPGESTGDFMIGDPGANAAGLPNAGTVYVYSGADGALIFQSDGSNTGDRLGGSVGIFESNSNGPNHFLMGAPAADVGAITDAGSAYVYQIAHRGDLNGDGQITPADVVLLLYCVFLGDGFCPLLVADTDCDGSLVSPSDIVTILNAAYLGTPIVCGP